MAKSLFEQLGGTYYVEVIIMMQYCGEKKN